MWCKTRHKVITVLFRPVFKLHFKIKYNLKAKIIAATDSKDNPTIILLFIIFSFFILDIK